MDRSALTTQLRRRVDQWREPLGGSVGQARQMLRKVVIGRLTLTPDPEENRSVRVVGDGTLTKTLAGIVVPKGMASLVPASWNQVTSWLRQVDGLRGAA